MSGHVLPAARATSMRLIIARAQIRNRGKAGSVLTRHRSASSGAAAGNAFRNRPSPSPFNTIARRDAGRALTILNQPITPLPHPPMRTKSSRRRITSYSQHTSRFRAAHPVSRNCSCRVQRLVELVGSRSPHLQRRASSPIAVVLLHVRCRGSPWSIGQIATSPPPVQRAQRAAVFGLPCNPDTVPRRALQGSEIAFERQ